MNHASILQNFNAQKFANLSNAQQSFVQEKLEKLANEQKKELLLHTTNNHSTLLQNFTEHQHRHSMKAHEVALQNATTKIEKKLQKQHKRVVNWAVTFSIIGSFVVILGCICTCFSCIYYKLNRTHNTSKNVWHTIGPDCPACRKGKEIRVHSPSKRGFSAVEEEIELLDFKPNEVHSKIVESDTKEDTCSIVVHEESRRANKEQEPSPFFDHAESLQENKEQEPSPSEPAVLEVENLSLVSGIRQKEGVTANVSSLRAIYESGKKLNTVFFSSFSSSLSHTFITCL